MSERFRLLSSYLAVEGDSARQRQRLRERARWVMGRIDATLPRRSSPMVIQTAARFEQDTLFFDHLLDPEQLPSAEQLDWLGARMYAEMRASLCRNAEFAIYRGYGFRFCYRYEDDTGRERLRLEFGDEVWG